MGSTADTLISITLVITFFTALVLVVYFLAKYTHLTKKALAESGQKIDLVRNKYIYQDIACMVIGLGIGLGFASMIASLELSEDTSDFLIYGTISLFTGIGLLMAHFLRRKSNSHNNDG